MSHSSLTYLLPVDAGIIKVNSAAKSQLLGVSP